MRGDMTSIQGKLEVMETKQEESHQANMGTHERIDALEIPITLIREVTGARVLADGQSAAFIINALNREERKLKEEEKRKREDKTDDTVPVLGQGSPVKKESKRKKDKSLPPREKKLVLQSPKRRISRKKIEQTDRLEALETDSGFRTEEGSPKEDSPSQNGARGDTEKTIRKA